MEEICPLQFAVETMEEKNNEMRSSLDQAYINPNFNISMLGMKLNGVVDAAVQGGTKKYEEAFFTDNYLKANPTHKARNCKRAKIIKFEEMIENWDDRELRWSRIGIFRKN